MSLPDGWANCRLEDLLASGRGTLSDGPFGSALKSEHYVDRGCRVIRLNNVGRGHFNDADRVYIDMNRFETLRRHDARAGDLVTAALGEPLGRTCVVPEGLGPAIVKADCFRTRLAPSVDADMVRYWMNSPALVEYFEGRGKGVGRIRINTRVLREAPLPLPPPGRQRAIATRLERIEARAELAKTEARKAMRAAEVLRAAGLRAGMSGDLTARRRAGSGFGESVNALLAHTPRAGAGPWGTRADRKRHAGRRRHRCERSRHIPPRWMAVDAAAQGRRSGHRPHAEPQPPRILGRRCAVAEHSGRSRPSRSADRGHGTENDAGGPCQLFRATAPRRHRLLVPDRLRRLRHDPGAPYGDEPRLRHLVVH